MESKKTAMKNKQTIWWSIPFLAALAVVLPLCLKEGIPFGNDASFHLSRIVSIAEGLKNGVFLPGVYADYFNGYGYGNGLFYPDLFLYIPALLMLSGIPSITAYKIFLVILTGAMACTMYFSVKTVWRSDFAASVSTVLYLLCSFHTTDLYQRSSVGELLAFVFLPLIVAGFWEVVYGAPEKWPLLFAGFTGLVLSHVLTAVMMGVFSAVFLLFSLPALVRERQRLAAFGKAVLWSVILTMFFLLPMLEQMLLNPVWGDTGLLGSISDWAVPFKDLILAVPQSVGEKYVPPAGIGLALTLLVTAGLFVNRSDKLVRLLSVSGLLLLFCASAYFPWHLLEGVLSILQFPWRLYLFISVFWCFASGRIVEGIAEKRENQAVIAAVTAGIMLIGYFVNVAYTYKNYAEMLVNTYPAFAAGCEYLPEDVTLSHLQEVQTNPRNIAKRTNYNLYSMNLERNASYELPLIYYSGYEAVLNGVRVTVSRNSNGMAEVAVNETGTLMVQYKGTLLRRVSETVSLLGVIVGTALLVKNRRKENDQNDRKVLSSE
ncbi:YfhO family protein [Eubacterium sp. 1001713B170207_170306_E7]|uniref:YfhO family protein n=1 Tax=Eubacterium sp. 1001713B170207_170306_E7 TaxID=2787097 RepID=UPI001896AFBE|nr:YfhO family protein [Eubacterium sp. 1001713B170207_170306_E7]